MLGILNLIGKTAEKVAEKVPIPSHSTEVPTVDLNGQVEDSSYFIAEILMKATDWFITLIGQPTNTTLFTWVYAILVLMVALVIGYILKTLVLFSSRKLGNYLNADVNKTLLAHHFYLKITHVFPALVFLILIQFTLITRQTLAMWLTRITWIYVVYCSASALAAFSSAIFDHVNNRRNTRKLPLRGLIQVVQGAIWIVAAIICLAILFNKSPGSLLAGLGAFAAVLMLVFKDSILGVVAGVQLSENDSLHVGDWISVNSGDANGTVIEVSLTAVKILNWDKTTSTVPPYSLVSNGFKNYRSMQESNTRRIQRSYMIDADSVVQPDDNMLEEFSKIPLMREWIEKKREQRDAGHTEDANNSAGLVDGSLDTNLGIFRAYVKMYLDSNPDIDKTSTCFVTTLPQSSTGIPLQVYCFTSTSSWLPYESIMAAVFEHMAVMLHKFKLYTFENPSGRDTLIDGYLSSGKTPQPIFGMPYPIFNSTGTPEIPGTPPAGLYPPLQSGATSAAQTSTPSAGTATSEGTSSSKTTTK